MASKLIRTTTHEAEILYELSMRQAFESLESKLRPPFALTVPNSQEYVQLNRAILYGVLCEPHFSKVHMKHLHAIVTDRYAFFVSLLIKVVKELYLKMIDSVRNQLIWVTKEMIDVSAVGFDGLLVCLLRQIIGGDFSDGNLRLCFELVSLFLGKWDYLLEEEPLILNAALYTFLRLLADHCRFSSDAKLDALRRLEIDFCVKMFREQFQLCMKMGRDLIRLLLDLVHVPVFRAIWKDLILNPNEVKTPGFSDISQLYHLRTSSRYFLTRITPEMETHLRFLLTHVKLGSQKRYQVWFAKKFLFGPERETLIVDIIRFICCGHHPSNEIIQSDVIPRWAIIGWLLKICRKNYVQTNAKLALFYDWLFFDESVENIMNIEPAMLLIVCSIPRYIEMTHMLLDFLFLLVDNYDVDRHDIIARGVKSALGTLVRKGVVQSLDVLTSCKRFSPYLKERLQRIQILEVGVSNELRPLHISCPSVENFNLPSPTPCSATEMQYARAGKYGLEAKSSDVSVPVSENLDIPCCLSSSNDETKSADAPVPVSEDLVSPCSSSPSNGETKSANAPVPVSENLVSPCCSSPSNGVTKSADAPVPVSKDLVVYCCPSLNNGETIERLVQNLGETFKNSKKMGLEILDELLVSFVKLESQKPGNTSLCPEVLSSRIAMEFELNGYKLFAPLRNHLHAPDCDDEIGSATAMIIRAFIYSQHERICKMLLSWSKNGYPVGARLLSYASRLAYEADVVKNVMVYNNIGEIKGSGMQLLSFHVDGYFCFLNEEKEDSSKSIISTATIDKQFAIKLVDSAFTAYRCFLVHMRAILHVEVDTSLSELLRSDLISCSEWEKKRLKFLFASIFYHLADISIDEENFIKLIVSRLDRADLIDMQLDIALKKYSLFGEKGESISHLIENSLSWDSLEQHNFWALIISELAVSKVQVEKLIWEFFCRRELDAKADAIAVGGLLALCSCCAPRPELVGVIMMLPNNVFQEFAAAALASWAVSNSSMLFDSLIKVIEKFDKKNGDLVFPKSSGIRVNHSASLWLSNHFRAQGMLRSDILSCLSVSIER